MLEVKNYDDMSHLKAQDIIDFMKEQTRTDIDEFKTYCSTEIEVKYKDGTTKVRKPIFFEIRRWVVDKYFPDALQANANGGKAIPTFYDMIMEL